jgi:hypothetical protein
MAMRFAKIKISSEGVELDRVEQIGSASVKTTMTDSAGPLPSFRTALQAFSGYACDLLGAPEWHESVNVSSIHLSKDSKTNRRGLMVTITRKIERAKNRVMTTNTPLMHAPGEDQEGTNPGTYPKEVADMIVNLEAEAAKYWSGEREQGEIFDRSQTEKQPQDGPAPAKPRGKKNRDHIPGVGPVMNPDATEQMTDENLRQLLLRVERDMPIDAIATLTSGERDAAQRWAAAIIESKLNNRPYTGVEPEAIKRLATPALADGWTQDSPPPKAGEIETVTT